MAGEEGLVIPTFGIDPDADNLVLPDLPPPAPRQEKPAPTPTRFDPEGRGPRQGMGFLENLLGTLGSGTIEGTLNQAEAGRLARGGIPLPETTAIDQGSGFVPELDQEQARALRDEAQQAVFDQVAYDLAPTRITPAGVAGTLAGQVLAPSNLAGFGGETAARFLAGRGYGAATQTAARFGAQALGTSAITQEIRRESGAIDHFSLPETLLAGVAGSVLGAGTHVAGRALGKAAGGVAEFVRSRVAQRQALGIDVPREALAGGSAASDAQPPALPQPAEQTARTAPAEAALRSEEPARGMPAAEPDATAPVSREQADGRAEPPPPAVEPTATGLPPVPEGHVRMFHGGEDPAAGGSRWATPDPQYARDFGTGGKAVHYVDVPADHPALARTVPDEDVAAGVPQSFGNSELPEDVARGFRPVPPAGETFEARSARLSAERRAMQDSGAAASPEGRDLYEALGTADSERNADPAWATRHIDEALKVGRTDVADHIVEGAERRAVEAERVASETAAAEAERDTADTQYATAIAQEDAQQARATADAVRRQREEQAAPDRGALDERSSNTGAADAIASGARRGGEHGFQGSGERIEVAIAARRRVPAPAETGPALLDSAETSLVEAATRLHGTPAQRRVSVDELRAAVPDLSTPEFERAVTNLHGRGVAQFADGAVSLDHAGVRAAQKAVERHVRTEAESIGRELFGQPAEVLQRSRRAPAGATVEEADQIRQGRPVEDQGTAPIEGDARPARLEEMAQRLASDFETVLRTGRVQPSARGQFDTGTGVARVRSLSDLDTTLHEIGHSVQQSPQTAALVDPVIARNRAELTPLGAGTGVTGDAEAFAELFRLYATNRAYAERTYPGATADLERTLRADLPAQADALDRLRAELDTIHRADSGAVVGSDVITPKPDGLFRRMLKLLGTDIGASEADPSGTVFYTWRDALYARMVSTQHPIGKAQEALARLYRSNTGETLNLLPQDDAYIRGRLASGSRAVADAILARGVRAARGVDNEGPSFRDAVVTAVGKRWTGEQWHDFGAYLTARSMVADYERFAAGEIPNPPGKLSAGDYAKAVQEFEARYPTFADGAEQLYTFQRNLLQRHFDLGLFTKGYYDAAMARRDYVPKMRDMEDLGQSRIAGSGKRDGGSVMKAFRGSQRSVMNPLDAIYARVHELETAAALNETKAALARLAETAGPGSGFIAEPVPANKLSSVRVDVVDALRAAGSRANVDNLDLGALIQQAEGLLGDDVFSHIFRQEPIRPGAEPITFYYVNGERRALRLADGQFGQALYNALNTVTEPERNVFVSVLQIGQQVLRSGVTKSLGFIYRNPVRDQFTSTATGARKYIPFVSAFQGLYDIASHGGDFERYLSHGGFAGGAIHEAIEGSALKPAGPQSFREKAWWNPTRFAGAAARAAELSEAATRAGLFQSYTKQAQGLGHDAFNTALYATFNANDYIDFRRTGSDLAVVRRFVPFLGATIQGTDKEARSLIGDMVRLEGKRFRGEELSIAENDKLQTARAAWVKTLGLGLVMGGGTAYLNAQDPEWFGAAAWRRHRAYNITPAGPEGNWFDMPKPFGLVRNVSDTFEYGVEYLFRQDPTLLKKWGEALADAHTVPYTNPFIDVFYNARANYDAFRDRPIVPPSLQSLPPSEQYTRYTSEIAKAIGQVTGWSPMKTDYVAKSLGGGTAIDWLRNADTLIRWMQGKPGGKEKTIWDLPLARELVQNLAVGSEATTRFYGLVGQKVGSLEQAATAYGQKIATGDRTGAESYLRNLPENERAYAVLMKTTFDADDRLMHPLALARAYNAVIGGVSKALGDGNLLPEGDLDRQHITLSRREGQPIHTDGPTTEKLRNALDALSMVTARNALIAYGADGMQGVPVKDPAEFLDRIRMLSPDVARELRGRLAAKRLYDPATVAERWPEVKARLLKDGEGAEFNDLLPHRARSAKRERKRALQDD